MSTYTRRKQDAVHWGYPVPPDGSPLDADGWNDAWIRYWHAMDLHREDPVNHPGRPVQPHRSGGGRVALVMGPSVIGAALAGLLALDAKKRTDEPPPDEGTPPKGSHE